MSNEKTIGEILSAAANSSASDYERLAAVLALCAVGLPSAAELKALMKVALMGSEAGEATRQALLAEIQAPTLEAQDQLTGLGISARIANIAKELDELGYDYALLPQRPEMGPEIDSMPKNSLAGTQPHRGWGRTRAEELAKAWVEAQCSLNDKYWHAHLHWDKLSPSAQEQYIEATQLILQQYPVLQRGGIFAEAELQAFEQKPDPSLERIANALETLVSKEHETQAAQHGSAHRILDDYLKSLERYRDLQEEQHHLREQLAHKQRVIDHAYDALNEFQDAVTLDSLPGILDEILNPEVTPEAAPPPAES